MGNKESNVKNRIPSACIGEKGREIYKTLTFDSTDDETKSGSV